MKRMYVVRAEQGGFWCGLYHWDTQLRKAQIFHSLKYAGDVVERFKQYNPKIVEVSLAIVNEPQTHADRIRAMSDEELAEWIHNGISSDACDYCEYNNGYCDGSPCRGKTEAEIITDWLKQPAKDGDNDDE